MPRSAKPRLITLLSLGHTDSSALNPAGRHASLRHILASYHDIRRVLSLLGVYATSFGCGFTSGRVTVACVALLFEHVLAAMNEPL
ncbi:hypothetical protein PLICRDRAFT_47412 [Plicaturopsis crispa FD-325 SS-3]|uniref:Uncharacterized protein n=1 Tax=Plicaturopsis crispa FD-325 SS-3 TaxID=944288 RepID=A0A0C9SPW9_PLICR|nr:hypothetical protein PLICRDRAFT_47412 [Plicaturopsis crispa FD-325 SS-3]